MSKKNIAILQILACSALWSIAGVIMKQIPWSGFAIAGIRSLLAGSVALVYMRFTKQKFVINKHSLFGGICLGVTMMLFCAANKMTTAANAIVLQFTSPVFIMIISAVFLKKRFSRADILAVVLSIGGISLFFLDKLDSGKTLGNLVALFTGLSFGCYYISLGTSPENERTSAIVIANAIAFIVGIPFIIATKPVFTGVSVLCIVVLGIFQLGIPYVLLAKGSGHCPPLVCSLLGALEPLLNPVWVFIFDGEAPGLFALLGGAVVIITISVWCVYNNHHEKHGEDSALSEAKA